MRMDDWLGLISFWRMWMRASRSAEKSGCSPESAASLRGMADFFAMLLAEPLQGQSKEAVQALTREPMRPCSLLRATSEAKGGHAQTRNFWNISRWVVRRAGPTPPSFFPRMIGGSRPTEEDM